MHTLDLSNCEKEAIHIPGKIQGHGFLIALDYNLIITHCSSNINRFLPSRPGADTGETVIRAGRNHEGLR